MYPTNNELVRLIAQRATGDEHAPIGQPGSPYPPLTENSSDHQVAEALLSRHTTTEETRSLLVAAIRLGRGYADLAKRGLVACGHPDLDGPLGGGLPEGVTLVRLRQGAPFDAWLSAVEHPKLNIVPSPPMSAHTTLRPDTVPVYVTRQLSEPAFRAFRVWSAHQQHRPALIVAEYTDRGIDKALLAEASAVLVVGLEDADTTWRIDVVKSREQPAATVLRAVTETEKQRILQGAL